MNAVLPDDVELQRMQDAADWLIQLAEAPDDEAVINRWLQWCGREPENLPAFLRAQKVWQLSATPAPSKVWRDRRFFAAAATLVLGVLGTAWFLTKPAPDTSIQSYETPVASVGSSVLPDGSKVDLGALSRITTQYSSQVRSVTVDAGEAFFSVSKDSRRPFIVSAGGVRIEALGTEFNVRHGKDRIIVAVSEGVVAVASPLSQTDARVTLSPGQQAIYLTSTGQVTVTGIHPHDAASWRTGVLKYVHEPLGTVTADLNRYSTRQIVVTDPALSRLPFTGTVFSTRITDALEALEDVFPLRVVESDQTIELRPRE